MIQVLFVWWFRPFTFLLFVHIDGDPTVTEIPIWMFSSCWSCTSNSFSHGVSNPRIITLAPFQSSIEHRRLPVTYSVTIVLSSVTYLPIRPTMSNRSQSGSQRKSCIGYVCDVGLGLVLSPFGHCSVVELVASIEHPCCVHYHRCLSLSLWLGIR